MKHSYETYAFASTKCLSREEKRLLTGAFADVDEFMRASEDRVMSLQIIDKSEYGAFLKEAATVRKKDEYRRYCAGGNDLVMIYDSDFPEQLRYIHNVPTALFYRGSLPHIDEKNVAMVGARKCSAYGSMMAGKIAKSLAENGFSVVSGMAYGIDAASHRGAIAAGGRTYAFFGNGIDICYPEANREIYDSIPLHGAIISEYPPGMEPTKQAFPDRNRLISGLSGAVVVIEAKERSGSLITADMALDQGRDVYALPGRVTDLLSAGTNRLIWQGAGIIRSPEALIAQLKMEDASFTNDFISSEMQKLNLEKDEMVVYSSFDFYAKSIDEVSKECNLTLLEILGIVNSLCSRGYLKEVFMNHYVRNVPA